MQTRRDLSQNVELAHAIGLLSHVEASDLFVIADVRNAFAHDPSALTFESRKVADKLYGLRWGGGPSKDPKSRFMLAVFYLRDALKSRGKNVKPFPRRRDFDPDPKRTTPLKKRRR
jgi:hypothetical protein